VETFDLIVIGSGSAGVSAALRASDQGARVCIIEADRIGGSCVHKGLYPLKLGLDLLNRSKEKFFSNNVADSEKLFNSITETMGLLSHSWEQKLINSGVTIKLGEGLPVSSSLVQVKLNDDSYDVGTKKVIIATGSKPTSLSTIPFEQDAIISPDDIFKSYSIPERVFIMGSAGSACEISYFYQMLGSKVFLGGNEPRLFSDQDPDISDAVEKILKSLKIKLLLGKKISSYYKNNDFFDITLAEGIKFQADKIILNLGRQGNSENLNCDMLGIRVGDEKEIFVNERLETSVSGVFAVGSVTGRKTRSGISEEEGKISADNAMGKNKSINYDWIPQVCFTSPEVATVGCYTEQAHHKGFRGVEGCVQSRKLDFSFLCDFKEGFFKIVADARSGIVIGGQIVSPNASQLISLVVLAIKKGMKVGALLSLASDKSSETEGIKEAARLCSNVIKTNIKADR
jgi:dihydrolipoamide dehydrogenase